MSEAYLTVGDSSLLGALNLLDYSNYAVLSAAPSLAGGGQSFTPGVQFGPIDAQGLRAISLGLMVRGSSFDEVEDNYNQLARMLLRAKLASGPSAQGAVIYFRHKGDSSATNPVHFPLRGGLLTPIFDGVPDGKLLKLANVRLDSYAYSQTAAVVDAASGTLTNGAASSVIARAGVLGTVESLITTTLTDLSTGLPTVAGLTITQAPTGFSTLGAGTYWYRVSGINKYGENIPCAQASGTIIANKQVQVVWTAQPAAVNGFNVYGRTSGAELFMAHVSAGANVWTDDGTVTPAGAIPTTDLSLPVITRFTLGRLARLPSLASSPLDFSGIYDLTAVSPGVASTDNEANYLDASFARWAAPTADWQTLAQLAQPAGAFQHGLFHPKLRVRDAGQPLNPPSGGSSTTSVTGGSLTDGTYAAFLTTRDAGGNESLPTALPPAIVGVNPELFFEGAENGDFSLFDVYKKVQLGAAVQNGASAGISIDPGAAHTATANSQNGFKATSAAGIGAWIAKAGYGGGATGAMRDNIRIDSDSGATSTVAWNAIPLITDSAGNLVLGLFNTGQGYKLGTQVSGTAAVVGPQVMLSSGAVWQTLEVVFTWNNPNYTVSIYVDDQQTVTNQAVTSSTAPGKLAIGALSFGAGTAFAVSFDNVQMSATHIGAPTGSATWTWTATAYSPNMNGYYLYVQRNGGQWWRFSVSIATTYTLTALGGGTPVSGPPAGAPQVQPALFRIGVSCPNAPTVGTVWSRAVSALACNNLWETLRFAPLPLPPEVRQQGVANGAETPWLLTVQALSNSVTPATVDVDCLWLFPHTNTDALCTVEIPSNPLPAAGRFILNRRWDGEMSAHVYQGPFSNTLTAIAQTHGHWSFGPGDNIIVSEVEVANPLVIGGPPVSDVRQAQYSTQHTHRARREHGAGVLV